MSDTEHAELARRMADPDARVHFVGVAGTGMSALAQYRALQRRAVSGSDRTFDHSRTADTEREQLRALGVQLFPQDGSGVIGAAVVITSTAVESAIPDLVRARELGIPLLHRADLLAIHSRGPSVAIAGTSGKSTVTAMVFEILAAAGRDPGLITGGRLIRLMAGGEVLGNAAHGAGPVVFEADESDGSLVRHEPEAAVLLNLHRDHMEPAEAMKQFRTLRARTRGVFVVSDDAPLHELRGGALVFGFTAHAKVRATSLRLSPDASDFRVGDIRIHVPTPGEHNARNALAAFAMCRALGVDAQRAADALADYRGVHRRMQQVGAARGVIVIDDFAHNPDKIRAAMVTAAARGKRLLACFQPHGFAPTRFLRDDLIATFDAVLRRERDRLWLADIFYAGGTAARDIASTDLVADLVGRGAPVEHAPDRARLIGEITAIAQPGDVVLVMGARDETLHTFAKAIVAAL